MFPPASPMTERVRVQSELEALEREAIWREQTQPMRRWSLPKLFSFRRLNAEKRPEAVIQTACAEC